MNKEELIQKLKSTVSKLKVHYGVGTSEFEDVLKKCIIKIPTSIFSRELGVLETVCRYLKDELDLNFIDISVLMHRDERSIWSSYNNSLKKRGKLDVKETEILIPLEVFRDRKFSSLESVVGYLKGEGLSLHEIGVILKRDDRTIWTVYDRFKKKRWKGL